MPTPRLDWKNLPATALQQDEGLLQDWDRLNATRGDLPFLAGEAIVSALTILGDGCERLLVAHRDNEVIAMFLLVQQGKLKWQTFQPSQLPLGGWVAQAAVPLQDITRSLLSGPLGFCLVLSITQVDPRVAQREADAPDSQTNDYIDTGWIDIDGSFDEYWAARGKNLRQNMRKQRSKLLAEGVAVSMQVLREHADMAPAIARYGVMESAGWKAGKGTAIHPDNAQGRYYRELLEQASVRGEAVVYQYLFGDRVVAMNLCLERAGTLVVLKTTYDESIQSFSPAFLLRETELQEIYRDGRIKRMEYFGRLMDWHTKLTSQKRTLFHLTMYRWPFLKKLAEARRHKVEAAAAPVAAAAATANPA